MVASHSSGQSVIVTFSDRNNKNSNERNWQTGNFQVRETTKYNEYYATGAIQLKEKPEIPWLLHIAQVNQSL